MNNGTCVPIVLLLLGRSQAALDPGVPKAVVFPLVGGGDAVLLALGAELVVCWRARLCRWAEPRSGLRLGQGYCH